MSETLSAEELVQRLRDDYGKGYVYTSSDLVVVTDTIEELQAELQEQRRVVKAAEVIIANADGHPAMCCGKCSSAIAKAEAEVTRLRERLWHHHQADGLETDPHHCRYCQEAGGTTWT